MSLVVYSDLTGVETYLADRALGDAPAGVDWRMVEQEPALPVTGRRLTAAEQDEQAARLAAGCRIAVPDGDVPPVPGLLPNTEGAVSAYAEAYHAGVASRVRRLLLDLYWTQGADIGSFAVLRHAVAEPIELGAATAAPLREFGFAVSVDRGPITSAAYRTIRAWRREWEALGAPAGLVLVDGSTTYHGPDALRELRTHTTGEAAPPTARARATVAPHPGWVSQTGGNWVRTYRLRPHHRITR